MDATKLVYESFKLFSSVPNSNSAIHMSSGVNWQDASQSIIDLLKTELDMKLTYKNYGRSSGAKIVTDIVSNVEKTLASSKEKISTVIVNGASDGAHILLSHLIDSGKIDTNHDALMLGYSFPFYSTLIKGFDFGYQEYICPENILPSAELVSQKIAEMRPSILVIALPHNPTGIIQSADYYRDVIAAAKRFGTVVIVDRVCLMPWDMDLDLQAVIYDGIVSGSVFVVDSLSKSNSLAGVRIGYILAATQYNDELEEVIRYRNLNPAVFSTPTMAMCKIATLALHKGKSEAKKYKRLLRRYYSRLWLEYPSDFEIPDLLSMFDNTIDNYILDQQKLRRRFDQNCQMTKAMFSADMLKPAIFDGGFNMLLELPQMWTEYESEDQRILAFKYGVCVLTERCFRNSTNEKDVYFIRLSLTLPIEEFYKGLVGLQQYYLTDCGRQLLDCA